MKKILIAATILAVVGCKNNPTQNPNTTTATKDNTNQAAQTTQPQTTPTDSTNGTTSCASVGRLINKFEQNGAKFERFSKTTKSDVGRENADEWLKITLPDGTCKIVDSIGEESRYSCSFQDWNGDGFKDRIDSWKWHQRKWLQEVSLFSKTKNDFSDKIEGKFKGEQHDYDKVKGFKWQVLEYKMSTLYQLYKLEGLKVKVLSAINFNDDDGSITIEASATQKEAKEVPAKTFLVPNKQDEKQREASVKRYWDSIAKTLK
jgi:hypothetical protein